jgi:hypothetical protein
MTLPKANPKQRGRKSWARQPLIQSERAAEISNLKDAKRAAGAKQLRDFVKYFNDDGIAPAPPMTDKQRLALNVAAAQRALQQTLKDPEQHNHFTRKMHEDGWPEAARDAAYHQQIEHLGLKPWQSPPVMLECDYQKFDDVLAKPDHADYAPVLLTTKLIRHGVSVFEPDPLRALKQKVKNAKRGRPPR